MTGRQQEVARLVILAWRGGSYYRAASSGERVTLASLYRADVLSRRAWRGEDGKADAAYEYRPSDSLLERLSAAPAKGSE